MEEANEVAIVKDIERHYAHGNLDVTIKAELSRMGLSSETLRTGDLSGIDQFHLGGRQATTDLADQMGLDTSMSVLDIGSGMGGVARSLARSYGCAVTGIDLSAEYVSVAETFTRLLEPEKRITFQVGSATDLKFSDGCFDAVSILHVGMNISDKRRMCTEVARVLKPRGIFAVYDVMRVGDGELKYPLPWARTHQISFVADAATYRQSLEEAGFAILAERDRREFALSLLRKRTESLAESRRPPLGLHILMGAEAKTMIANLMKNIENGLVAPIEMICRLQEIGQFNEIGDHRSPRHDEVTTP